LIIREIFYPFLVLSDASERPIGYLPVQQHDLCNRSIFALWWIISYDMTMESSKLEGKKCKKNVTGILPVTFLKSLFSSENISSEGFRIGLLIPMPFEAMRHHHHFPCLLPGQ